MKTQSMETLRDVGLLVLRVALGLMLAFGHGYDKLPPSEGFIDAVGSMGFPLPVFSAWAAALSESVGATLMALGLFTRPSAILVALTMAGAAFVTHGADPFEVKEKALVYLAGAIAIALTGAGRFSFDHLIGKRRRRVRGSADQG